MADNTPTTTPPISGNLSLRGLLPRKGMVSNAVRKVRDEINGTTLLKSVTFGSVVGVAITAVKSWASGYFDPSDMAAIVGTGAAVGTAHAIGHSVLENGVDGAHEAIKHNRTCDQIENALCQNPELLADEIAQADAKAASYQVGSGDNPAKANPQIQQMIATRGAQGDMANVERLAAAAQSAGQATARNV